jgi:hypothetical protein
MALSYQLQIGGTETINNPTAEDLKKAIRSIAKVDEDPFVILQKGASGFTYIQALLESESLWRLEYQDGHLDQHFVSAKEIGTEDVIRTFVLYLQAEERWRAVTEWEAIKL